MSDTAPNPNPYAPPEADLTVAPPSDLASTAEAVAIRERYIGHEASVRSIGSLFDLAAVVNGIVIAFGVVALLNSGARARSTDVGLMGSIATFGVLVFLGRGLKNLKPWARWATLTLFVLLVVSMLFMIAGSVLLDGARLGVSVMISFAIFLIPVYVIYLLLCQKSAFVFTPRYREIINETQGMKYKTGLFPKLLLGAVILLFLIVLVFGVG